MVAMPGLPEPRTVRQLCSKREGGVACVAWSQVRYSAGAASAMKRCRGSEDESKPPLHYCCSVTVNDVLKTTAGPLPHGQFKTVACGAGEAEKRCPGDNWHFLKMGSPKTIPAQPNNLQTAGSLSDMRRHETTQGAHRELE